MTKDEILQFINANPACCLATVEDDRPRVRGMLMYRADETGILFHTGEFKDLFRQIQKNPHAEACFTSPDGGIQVRVSGTVRIIEDLDLKKEIVAAREFLQMWVYENGYDTLKVFRLSDCTATVWTFETNFMPKEYMELT